VSGGKIKDSGRSSGGSSFGSKVKQSLGFGKSSSSSGTPIRDRMHIVENPGTILRKEQQLLRYTLSEKGIEENPGSILRQV
jgi:hypothetical protein